MWECLEGRPVWERVEVEREDGGTGDWVSCWRLCSQQVLQGLSHDLERNVAWSVEAFLLLFWPEQLRYSVHTDQQTEKLVSVFHKLAIPFSFFCHPVLLLLLLQLRSHVECYTSCCALSLKQLFFTECYQLFVHRKLLISSVYIRWHVIAALWLCLWLTKYIVISIRWNLHFQTDNYRNLVSFYTWIFDVTESDRISANEVACHSWI